MHIIIIIQYQQNVAAPPCIHLLILFCDYHLINCCFVNLTFCFWTKNKYYYSDSC